MKGARVPCFSFWIDGGSGDDFDYVSLQFRTKQLALIARTALALTVCGRDGFQLGDVEADTMWDENATPPIAYWFDKPKPVHHSITSRLRVTPDGTRLLDMEPLIGTPLPGDPNYKGNRS